ncbi:type III-B CRISPR module-associated protein Cmr5 [Porphyromonas cangingivalis]|uniref:CRISPR type III-B/RAMP module-associated protein Cmr5 n=1 Tax=Porphyromonas cangingivalis TaxID=36874 RepID=A0A1T4JLB6_PORCN|nr:type III-B CRISPR module-associated protein Cmr5 [Porphyromonas cangingivalis]SJZ30956.1 CRISPR-associated protein Cmr5 [Porphyromonas cangingivalis]VEJ04323.1 CRISPR type III-B/RAMP module-associated protein Cmr5 [Porphyromonas cangingivalis]
MDKKRIQTLIPLAMRVIEKVKIVDTKTASFEKVHEGYINALGPNIIQSGLLPTLIFYNKDDRKKDDRKKDDRKKDDRKKDDRRKWLEALYLMYYMDKEDKEVTADDPTAIIKLVIGNKGGNVGSLTNALEYKSWEKLILEYAVALKLALRTFTAREKEKKEGGNE